jgi:hypothetical protein
MTGSPDSRPGRRRLRLATVATVIGIATGVISVASGAVDLGAQISADEEDPVLQATYAKDVGSVCDEVDDAQRGRRARALRLERQLSRAAAMTEQQTALLENAKHEIARSAGTLAMLQALTPPDRAADVHTSVVRSWERNLGVLRGHRDRIEAAGTGVQLVIALASLDRTAVELDGQRVNAGLRRLGGADCDIAPPPAMPAIALRVEVGEPTTAELEELEVNGITPVPGSGPQAPAVVPVTDVLLPPAELPAIRNPDTPHGSGSQRPPDSGAAPPAAGDTDPLPEGDAEPPADDDSEPLPENGTEAAPEAGAETAPEPETGSLDVPSEGAE